MCIGIWYTNNLPMRYLAVLDCNNFFVSCERLFRPDLRRVPVVVLSSNDGCVVARSQEIKDNGIPMGVPYFQVKDILKDIGAVCFSSHFALYRDISARVFSVVKEKVGEIEQYSIDEAFFVFDAVDDEAALEYGKVLKMHVERFVGIPVSIGISDTKTRAKLVNAYAKKNNGVAVFVETNFTDNFATTGLSEVWGIGRQLSVRYRQLGLLTIADLLTAPTNLIQAETHSIGVAQQAELMGKIIYPLTISRELPKSIMSTRSFAKKTNDWATIQDALAYHVRHVFEDLRHDGLVASGLRVLLQTSRHGDWRFFGGSREVIFEVPTASTKSALKEALLLLQNMYEVNVPYTKTGVIAYGLVPRTYVPTSLFSQQGDESMNGLDQVVDTVNARFGRHAIAMGVFTKESKWQAKHEQRSQAYTTDWQSLRTVQA
jgi:DNA polymerase V